MILLSVRREDPFNFELEDLKFDSFLLALSYYPKSLSFFKQLYLMHPEVGTALLLYKPVGLPNGAIKPGNQATVLMINAYLLTVNEVAHTLRSGSSDHLVIFKQQTLDIRNSSFTKNMFPV